jgi:demethylmenaquinone methyltransferase / 2-methoxy-6-polyprenyl-1,4-benzoquinol methylase
MAVDPITIIPRSQFVQVEFSQIAERYELMNQFMTFGQVNRLRKTAIKVLEIQSGMKILDLGAGGGQISHLIKRMHPNAYIYPSDFNTDMIRADVHHTTLPFSLSDARKLPYPDNSFERVICGFLLRNVRDYPTALTEIYRVLKPGGKFVSLDTTPPAKNIFSPFIWLHMRVVIPIVGTLVTGRINAYRYLIRSSEGFTPAGELEQEFVQTGFKKTGYRKLMFGAFALNWGIK